MLWLPNETLAEGGLEPELIKELRRGVVWADVPGGSGALADAGGGELVVLDDGEDHGFGTHLGWLEFDGGVGVVKVGAFVHAFVVPSVVWWPLPFEMSSALC